MTTRRSAHPVDGRGNAWGYLQTQSGDARVDADPRREAVKADGRGDSSLGEVRWLNHARHPRIRAGRNNIAVTKASTAPTLMPISFSGIEINQTMGYRAKRQSAEHSANASQSQG